MTVLESATIIFVELVRKSGIREWEEPDKLAQLQIIAIETATFLNEAELMSLPDFIKVKPGTPKVFRNTGGDAAITLASLANAAARQSVTLDLGEQWAREWRLDISFELAATPTAGAFINLFASYSGATGAGKGNTSGTDAAYTGYNSNIPDSSRHLTALASHVCTANPTATVQQANLGVIIPRGRYMNLVIENRSGAAFHNTETNQFVSMTPLDEQIQDAV